MSTSFPEGLQFRLHKGAALHQQGQLAAAQMIYEEVLRKDPGQPDALHLHGVLQAQIGNPARGLELIDRALAVDPGNPMYLGNRASVLRQLGRRDDALACLDELLARKPEAATAWQERGLLLQALGQPAAALESLERALALAPDDAALLANLGTLQLQLGQGDAARASYARALALRPEVAALHANHSQVLLETGQPDAALAAADRALALDARLAEAHNNRGLALLALTRVDEALACFERAIALNDDYAEAYHNRGSVQLVQQRPQEALNSINRALALAPGNPDIHNSRGNVFLALGQPQYAIGCYERAVRLRPDFAAAHLNLANALMGLKRYEDAIAAFARVLALKPATPFVPGTLLHARMHVCDWQDFAPALAALTAGVAAGRPVTPVLPLLTLCDDPALQRRAAELWVRQAPAEQSLPQPDAHERIRIGYFSPDFREHAVSYLMAEVFERHDRARFEVIAFAFGPAPDPADAVRARLEKAFDRFIDVHALTDDAVVALAREQQLDIAVDLAGFTQGARTGVFARRVAPVQASYLGYLGSMGAPFMDYLLADPVLVPERDAACYAEKIVALPWYQANDTQRAVADKIFTRAELGLPEQGFVFCSFNALYKLTPDLFARWMRILAAVPDSVLWILVDNDTAPRHLAREAAAHGIAPERLVFAPRLMPALHLARLRAADLFLDTLPCNAGASANDALRMGLPVLTSPGRAFASRIAASVLTAAGVPELIAPDLDAYERSAIALAQDGARLAALKARLANVRDSALFDTAAFTHHLERAFVALHERARAGLPPDHLRLAP